MTTSCKDQLIDWARAAREGQYPRGLHRTNTANTTDHRCVLAHYSKQTQRCYNDIPHIHRPKSSYGCALSETQGRVYVRNGCSVTNTVMQTIPSWPRLRLYKILVHFKALLWEPIMPFLPPSHLQGLPYLNKIARTLRNIFPHRPLVHALPLPPMVISIPPIWCSPPPPPYNYINTYIFI